MSADSGEYPQHWHAYFNVHGDPFVVGDPGRANTTVIATVATTPDDYGRANALLLAAAPALKAENERLRVAMGEAIRHIDTNHRLSIKEGYCLICGASDGHWPCLAVEATRELRATLEAAESASSERLFGVGP